MNKLLLAGTFAGFLLLFFHAGVNAQCTAKQLTFPEGGDTITINGKTNGCNKFNFSIEDGQRLIVKISSTDNRARFNLKWNASEDETGMESFENQTSFDKTLNYPDWELWVTGTASTAYTLKITAVSQ